MCNKGRRQSPINVEPDKLLFDPYLRPLHIDKHKVVSHSMQIILRNNNERDSCSRLFFRFQVTGMLHNTGQSLVFRVDKDTKQHVNISGGPLGLFYRSSKSCELDVMQ